MTSTPCLPDLNQITVIMVTYNSAHCIPAQARQLHAAPHIIVVDNASNDETTSLIQKFLPQATVIENSINRGFGAANNLALQQTRTPYALLLNPDCILTPAYLMRLLEFAQQHAETAIVAPQLVDQNHKKTVNYRWPNFYWQARTPAADGPCCVGFVSAACILLNLSQMQKVGFFDETFFLYFEDDDLCTRTFLQKLPIVVLPTAVAVHASRGSVAGKSRWRSEYRRGYCHAQSKILYTHKYRGAAAARKQRWRVLISTLLATPLRILFFAPALLARWAGRIMGLIQYHSGPSPSTPANPGVLR